MTSDRLNGASCDLWLGSGWLVVGRTAARRGRRVASLVARFGRAQAPVELRGDDLLHVLRNQTDDQVDEALLVAAIVVRPRSRLLVLEHAADLFGDAVNDRVDDALLVEVFVAPVAIAIMFAPIAVAPMAVTVTLPVVPTRVEPALERLQPFQYLAPVVVPHGNPPDLAIYNAGLKAGKRFPPPQPQFRGSSGERQVGIGRGEEEFTTKTPRHKGRKRPISGSSRADS